MAASSWVAKLNRMTTWLPRLPYTLDIPPPTEPPSEGLPDFKPGEWRTYLFRDVAPIDVLLDLAGLLVGCVIGCVPGMVCVQY